MLIDYLLCLLSTDKRRYQVVYYTLVGKRTTSNLYAALDYDIIKWLQIYPNLSLTQFQAILNKMVEAGWLVCDDHFAWLTPAGDQQKQAIRPTLFWPKHYDGPQMGKLTAFQSRLLLALQITSEYAHHNQHYFPVTISLHERNQVVYWFKQHKQQTYFPQQVQTELRLLLQELTTEQANLLANRLVGHQVTGSSQQQLVQLLGQSPLAIELQTLDGFAQLLTRLRQSPAQFPILGGLVLDKPSRLSQSTAQTWQAIQSGQTVDQISQQRHIKRGTILEHLLEIAILVPQFPFVDYLTHQSELATLFAQDTAVSFQTVQATVPAIDFFEYRLYQIKLKVAGQ